MGEGYCDILITLSDLVSENGADHDLMVLLFLVWGIDCGSCQEAAICEEGIAKISQELGV